MRTLGLLGGMSWESTTTYYRDLNRGVGARLGGLHSAKLLLWSADFAEIAAWQHSGNWSQAGQCLAEAAQGLESAGAEGIVICTGTMHCVAPQIEEAIQVPLLHIADATARALVAAGVRRAALLGTRFTMEQTFFRDRIEQHIQQPVLVPDAASRKRVHDIIFGELCVGQLSQSSRDALVGIVKAQATAGADAIILGCTELSLLLKQEDSPLPLFDTTALHVEAALTWILGED